MDITNNLSNPNTITSSINPPKRVRLESDDWIDKAPRPRVLERWKEQESYIDYLESRLNQLQQSIESNELLREKETECKKLKSMLKYRFLTKTTQQQTLVCQRKQSLKSFKKSMLISFCCFFRRIKSVT